MNWIPPGAVQVFVAQVVLIILTIYALSSKQGATLDHRNPALLMIGRYVSGVS
jgi:hypothetical protein